MQIYGWYEAAKPTVYVLTDSSGREEKPKIGPLAEWLKKNGGRPGPLFGRFTDKNVYDAILENNLDFFEAIIGEIKRELGDQKFEYVVGDSAEGYNPVHDVTRLMIGAAVEMLEREKGLRVANYDYALVRPSYFCPDDLRTRSTRLDLDERQFARKETALKICYPEVLEEIHWQKTADSYRVEYIRPCPNRSGFDGLPQVPPFYEKLGEKKVREGIYKRAIRYEEHLAPLAKEIWKLVEKAGVPV
ncbi:MAG: hypothetical protein ACREH5_01195 [Candidatus Omnitrophota bacterium]